MPDQTAALSTLSVHRGGPAQIVKIEWKGNTSFTKRFPGPANVQGLHSALTADVLGYELVACN